MQNSFIALLLITGLTSCSLAKLTTATEPEKSVTVQVVEYRAGPAWDSAKPPEGQNLGGHFEMVADKFSSKQLLANGPTLDDFHGFYLFNVGSEDAVRSIMKTDQGLVSGVLSEVKVESWQLMIENLGADVGDKQLYVLNYNAGAKWQAGKTLFEQDLTQHNEHIQALNKSGSLLAGGPVTDMQGRYIVAANDLADIDRIVKSDPSVADSIFSVQIKPWEPFNRQGL